MKDREQKQNALRLSAASRWLPQLEVDVSPAMALARQVPLVTDLDVFSSMPDRFAGYRTIVFDCKTKRRESPVNRCLWLAGVLDRVKADQGFCILKKDSLEIDHRLMANQLRIVLLDEQEFDLYAQATCPEYATTTANVASMDIWEAIHRIPSQYPKLAPGVAFTRASYWMIDDAAEACRKTLSVLRTLQPELDPAKSSHVVVFFEFCTLFSRSLAIVACQLFKAYLHPPSKQDLSDPLLVKLYGGRDAYEHRNSLYKMLKSQLETHTFPDLALPEWESFVQLVRQLLDAPMESQHTPLILREIGFSLFSGDKHFTFARTLCKESAQGTKFAMMIVAYLCKAARLPPEFAKLSDNAILPLISPT